MTDIAITSAIASNYVHHPGRSYALDDLPEFKSLDDFEIFE